MDITVTEIMELADMHAYAKITEGTPAEQRPRNLLERRMQQIVSHVFGLQAQAQQCGAGAGCCAQAARIAELEAQLEAVGAGGVGPLVCRSAAGALTNEGTMPVGGRFWAKSSEIQRAIVHGGSFNGWTREYKDTDIALEMHPLQSEEDEAPAAQQNALAPCPFCGDPAQTDHMPEIPSFQVECSDSIGCTARITRDSELGAIEAWNCRAALAAPAQPVAWALQWPDDSRLNLSTVFDTQLEATDYRESCSDGVVVVPLYAAPQQAAQDALAYQAACSLATRLFKKHFSKNVEYASGKVTWGLCDTTVGVISQIVNMVFWLVEPAAQALDLIRVFWQQHTQADALSMSMDELHVDVERVIRAARGYSAAI